MYSPAHQSMGKQVLSNQRIRDVFAGVVLDIVYEMLRDAGSSATR